MENDIALVKDMDGEVSKQVQRKKKECDHHTHRLTTTDDRDQTGRKPKRREKEETR
jgi:hypothetical protein